MINLDTTSTSLSAILAGTVATNPLEVTCCYYDVLKQEKTDFSEPAGATNLTNVSSANLVTAVAAPGHTGTMRKVHNIFFYNNDTTTATVSMFITRGAGNTRMVQQTIAAGRTLQFADNGWSVL